MSLVPEAAVAEGDGRNVRLGVLQRGLLDYSTCHVVFSRLQYVSCRVLSITARAVSRFVDYSMCRVAFCRLHYV